jgi:hypothetical protein
VREVGHGAECKQWKLRLMRGLYERVWPRHEILPLFRFIAWLLVLPAALNREFWHCASSRGKAYAIGDEC